MCAQAPVLVVDPPSEILQHVVASKLCMGELQGQCCCMCVLDNRTRSLLEVPAVYQGSHVMCMAAAGACWVPLALAPA